MLLFAWADTTKDIEILVLRHQLAVLQPRTPRPRMSLDRASRDRRPRPAATHTPPPRPAGHAIQQPARAPTAPRPPLDHLPVPAGRPHILPDVRALIVRLATEILTWGYRRIHGALAGPGFRIGASTLWTILRTAGIDPAPRRAGPTRTRFLRAQAHALLACDLLPRLHHRAPALRVLRHRARHPPRPHPQRHRPLHQRLAAAGPQPAHGSWRRRPALPVPHPRPRRHVHRRVRRVFIAIDVRIIRTSVRHRGPLIAGRLVGILRRGPFDRLLTHQPTTRRGRAAAVRAPLQRSPAAPRSRPGRSPATPPHRTTTEINNVRRHDRLGGLTHEYQQVAGAARASGTHRLLTGAERGRMPPGRLDGDAAAAGARSIVRIATDSHL
jgi:putative transposase